jgi:hypothetical protein
MTRLRTVTGLIICGYLFWAAPAAADAVTEWNDFASRTIFPPAPLPGEQPLPGRPAGAAPLLDFAMVHAAIHDAVQAYEKRFRPYAAHIPHASGSRVAAVGKAARDVLVNRFPAQTALIEAEYQRFLTRHGLTAADAGRYVGQHAAAAIIARRANDGSYPTPPPPPDFGRTGAGNWRATPPLLLPFSSPWLGDVEPFTMKDPAQFRARRHPALTSREYARHYNEVKALGGPVGYPGVTRTPDQTQLAYFYSDNTIALFERTVRGVVLACETEAPPRHCRHLGKLGDSARLFALANLAAADGGITAWNSKKHYYLWRPISAIQQILPNDNDGNPLTEADAAWTPLIATPPYPDYTSGANNVSSTFTTILARFFDSDRVTFKVTSNAALAVPKERTYHRFSHLADDLVDVRVYQGIHFRFADTAALREGTRVANHAFNHYLRPRHERDHQHDHDCGHDDHDYHNGDH